MSTHVLGFSVFFQFFLHHFVLPKLATSSIRVKMYLPAGYCAMTGWAGYFYHTNLLQERLVKGVEAYCTIERDRNSDI